MVAKRWLFFKSEPSIWIVSWNRSCLYGIYMRYQHATGTAAKTPLTGTKHPSLGVKPAHRYLITHFACLSVLSRYLWQEFADVDEPGWVAIVAIPWSVGSHQLFVGQGIFRRPPTLEMTFLQA